MKYSTECISLITRFLSVGESSQGWLHRSALHNHLCNQRTSKNFNVGVRYLLQCGDKYFVEGTVIYKTCIIPPNVYRQKRETVWRSRSFFFVVVYAVPLDPWSTERGVWTPPPKFRRPSKIVPNSTRLWKLLKIAEFRTPTPQDVRKKSSKILKLLRFAVVLH